MTLAHKKRVAGRRASGQRNLHKKTFIIANINWCRRRRLRARCAQFDIYLSPSLVLLIRLVWIMTERKSESWATARYLDAVCIDMARLTHKRKNCCAVEIRKFLRHSSPSFVSAKHINCHACLRGWNNQPEASRRTSLQTSENIERRESQANASKPYSTFRFHSSADSVSFSTVRCLLNALFCCRFTI